MAYRVTYETSDGSVEDFTTHKTKLSAVRMARDCASGSALNDAVAVTRWFVEACDTTLLTFPVAR